MQTHFVFVLFFFAAEHDKNCGSLVCLYFLTAISMLDHNDSVQSQEFQFWGLGAPTLQKVWDIHDCVNTGNIQATVQLIKIL